MQIDAKLQTAVSFSLLNSVISVQLDVIIPLKIPACRLLSLKQNVLSNLPLFSVLTTVTNCVADR